MTDGAAGKMTLTETLYGIVCQVCNKRFSGHVPAQQHLKSEAHLRKVQLQEKESRHPFWCQVCSLLCNSPQQYATHCDSPRHHHMTEQLGIIQKQQVLTATQIQLRDGQVGDIQTDDAYPVKGEESRWSLTAGVVYEQCGKTKVATGFVPISPAHSVPELRMDPSSAIPPDGVYFEYNRGHCYVCGIELTSLQHKNQHVEGKQHKKKALTFGSGGGMNDGSMDGTQGVMMCSICSVPLSGELNVQQHFSSDKHKARKREHDRKLALSDPAPDANTLPQAPFSASTETTAFFSLHGPHSMPGVQGSFSTPSYQPQIQQQQREDRVADKMGVQIPQAFEWHPGGGVCRMCDQHSKSEEEFIQHLRSVEHKQREAEEKMSDCPICHVQYSDRDSARQHLNSAQHKENVLYSQQTMYSSAAVPGLTGNVRPENNLPSVTQSLTSSQLSKKMSDISSLEQAVKNIALGNSYEAMQPKPPQEAVTNPTGAQALLMTRSSSEWNDLNQGTKVAPSEVDNSKQKGNTSPAVPEYYFDGSRGICNVCKIEFTSRSHADSHLAGAKHKKAVFRWQSTVSMQTADAGTPFQAFDKTQTGVKTFSLTATEMPIHSSTSDLPKRKEAYRFDGNRGYCFACKIDLTSDAHAKQHLVGKRHQTATERWVQEGEICNYPLFCDICLKPFTGQESAAQHYSSEKHKKKLSLAEGVATAKKDPESGALMIVRDGQMWYLCETCKCPLNTLEQFRLHVNSPRHNSEVEKAKRQDHSNRSSPVDAGDGTAQSSPDPSDFLHLVTRSSVKTTPGVYLSHPLQSPFGHSGLVVTDPIEFSAIKLEPGTQSKAPDHAVPGLNRSASHNSNNGSAFTAIVGKSEGSSVVKVENVSAEASILRERGLPSQYTLYGIPHQRQAMNCGFSLAQDGPLSRSSSQNGGCSGSGQRFDDLAKGLGVRAISRGVTSSRGSRSAAQVLRFDGDYEISEENPRSLPGSAFTPYYQDPCRENYKAENTNASLTISSVHGGRALSMTEQEERQASGAVSIMSDKLTSIYTDPGSLPVRGILQASSEGFADQQRQSAPEPNPFKGFRYACLLCRQPMNTKEDFERHKKGLKHQMKSATVSAPDRSGEKLIKEHEVPADKECHWCRTRPRKYQVELMRKAMAHDSTVVYLPTGTGKTLAAMMTLSCMLTLNPTRPVLFLVDKVLLVLQQARYIINELGSRPFNRPHLTEDDKMEKRNLKVAVLCGGLSVRDGTPLWKHDVVVTTAAFCQNLLQEEVLRWANFSLVVFDEAHHCTKNHPYNKLLAERHNTLPVQQRPKVLGLTASPAGRRTEEETVMMLKALLKNLGGATIAIIEDKEAKEQLDTFSSSARLVPISVPMTDAEMGFHEKLLSYFIRAYVELMCCSNLQQISSHRLQALMTSKPPDVNDITKLAQHLMSEPDELSEMVQLAQTARMKPSAANQNWFENIRMHVMTVGMTLLNSEDGIDFVLDDLERLFNPDLNKCFDELKHMGLPCEEIATYINSLCDSAKLRASEEADRDEVGAEGGPPSSMSIFQELLVTLADPKYMNWDNQESMALVLVRERKVAHKFRDHLKRTSFVRQRNMRVGLVVGHGAGSGEGEGMNLRKQDKVLQGIKSHRYDIVVATSVAEEGVDIPECQLVVCLNPPTTVKALVQMRGRARKKDSYFVVLCSSEREKEKLEDLKQQEQNMKKAAARLTQQHNSPEYVCQQ